MLESVPRFTDQTTLAMSHNKLNSHCSGRSVKVGTELVNEV